MVRSRAGAAADRTPSERLLQAFLEVAPGQPAPNVAFRPREKDDAEVVLRPGSFVRDTLLVEYRAPFAANERAQAIALSALAWEGLERCEPFRELARPLADLPRLGRADPRKPWVISHGTEALLQALEYARERGAQTHVLTNGPRGMLRARDVVYWPAWRTVAFALLGRAAACVASGPMCPLGLDAERAGVPVEWLERPGTELAGIVVPSLLRSGELWRLAAENVVRVRAGGAPSPLITPGLLRKGRVLARAVPQEGALPSDWQIALRRYAKFRREPERFFRDSRYAALRAAGKWWFGR